MKLADKILNLRKKQGMSQEELAGKLSVSRQTVSRWEVGSAQPDASNILQLSKLFGVTADFLLNDVYEESDQDAPTAKESTTTKNIKTKQLIGFVIAGIGALGSFVLYVISRMVEVMVPRISYSHTGEKWYHWSSAHKGYSYKYFIQAYNLEILTVFFFALIIAGFIIVFMSRRKLKCAKRPD